MSALSQLGIVDLRGDLPVPRRIASATGKPQGIRASTRYAVLHYNGPEAPARAGGTRAQIVSWLREVVIPNHISRIGADGVQYHAWVARDGTIYQLKAWNWFNWHCGNYTINSQSIALHIPIGKAQQPTTVQWQRAMAFMDAVCVDYGFSRANVKGHLECGKSECPGVVLMPMLRQWRAGVVSQPLPPTVIQYKVKPGGGTLRNAPRRDMASVVRNVPIGTPLNIIATVQGEMVLGSADWYVIKGTPAMYIHSSAVEKVS